MLHSPAEFTRQFQRFHSKTVRGVVKDKDKTIAKNCWNGVWDHGTYRWDINSSFLSEINSYSGLLLLAAAANCFIIKKL
jgi:hypothetical protein